MKTEMYLWFELSASSQKTNKQTSYIYSYILYL